MKTIISIFFTIIISLSVDTFGQKFRTIEQYQNYFLNNYETLDNIEGLWYCISSQTYNIKQSGITTKQDTEFVAIIKEGNIFKQYSLKEGQYTPVSGTRAFKYTTSGYKYCRYNEEHNRTYYSEHFNTYSDKKKFSFEMEMTDYAKKLAIKGGFNPNELKTADFSYSYSKMFPLESDLQTINMEESKIASTGTGFAISSDGYIVTNYHVIEKATTIKLKGVNNDFTKSYSASVVQLDKNNDLVILKIDDYSKSFGDIPYVINPTNSNVGENIFVLGYPLTASMGEEIKLTNGIISSKSGFQGDITAYQVTAPIQPGNSGAPLFDKDGNLTGIINAKHLGAENAGYAIKSSYLINLIEALPTTIQLPTVSALENKPLTDQVNIIKKFVYIIEVN